MPTPTRAHTTCCLVISTIVIFRMILTWTLEGVAGPRLVHAVQPADDPVLVIQQLGLEPEDAAKPLLRLSIPLIEHDTVLCHDHHPAT